MHLPRIRARPLHTVLLLREAGRQRRQDSRQQHEPQEFRHPCPSQDLSRVAVLVTKFHFPENVYGLWFFLIEDYGP
jgi:hypothetical protein